MRSSLYRLYSHLLRKAVAVVTDNAATHSNQPTPNSSGIRCHRIWWHIQSATLALVLSVYSAGSVAIQASPHLFQIKQPDGTVISLHIRGDEHFNWLEDVNGYTVIESNSKYFYAHLTARKQLGATSAEVGKVNPQALGLETGILPPQNVINKQRVEKQVSVSGISDAGGVTTPSLTIAPVGQVSNLVVMIRFSDHASRVLPSSANMDVLFNATGGDPLLAPTGSVRDVYLENSYGQLDLQSTSTAWINVSQTEAYYANGSSGLDSKIWEALTEALTIADASINFNDYDTDGDGYIDTITFVHSGYGAEWGGVDVDGADYSDRIWSHKWQMFPDWVSAEGVRVSTYSINTGVWGTSGSEIGRIGVIAHETGHFFGLPDLYDIDDGGAGIGSYGLMGNAWGFDGSQYFPPHFSAWSKIRLGWITPTVVSKPGTYNLSETETFRDVIRIDNGFPFGEYLLLENRQPVGFDGGMPQGGLVVWHIDENMPDNTQEGYPGQLGWPENGRHYKVALLQADGNYELERGYNRGEARDVYHAAGVTKIGVDTIPSTDSYQNGLITPTDIELVDISGSASSMSFTYVESNQVPVPTLIFPRDNEIVAAGTTIDMTWNTNGAPVIAYVSDDMESRGGVWSAVSHAAGSLDWARVTGNARSGTRAWFASDAGTVTDQYLSTVSALTVPENGQLSFWHLYDTEAEYGGGVVEISTDTFVWNDLGPRMTQGGYNSTISESSNSPIAGRRAFSGDSGGYVETLVDLSSYAGQPVYIRFRMASGSGVSGNGWYVDDASLHTPITTYSLAYTDNCTPDIVTRDDMESGSGSWTISHAAGDLDWVLSTGNPYSGTNAWFASDPDTISDQYLSTADSIKVPDNGQLSFWHSYDTEENFDGGVVEISTDGVVWNDLGPIMIQGGYDSAISDAYSSPIAGRPAFSGNSGGYIETLIDLSSYSAQSVYIRFRMASDASASGNGWFIDDVSVLSGTHPWVPIGITVPGASSYSWAVPANTGDDYCLSVLGMTPGGRQSPRVITGPFTVNGVDGDGDGYVDVMDNCTQVPNPDQRDTDSDGYGNLCDGDLNNDGSTNTLDLNLYKRAHRTRLGDLNYNPDADFNGDESINTLDLNIYRSLHRKPPGPSCCGLF